MQIPQNEIEKWRTKFKQNRPSIVLREMAVAYAANKSTLGFMLSDLNTDISTEEVQAVWTWDMAKNGRGLSDADLDELLKKLSE